MTQAEMGEKVAAHDATLTQMNERLGSIKARLTSMEARMATKGELRGWAGLVSGLVALGLLIRVYAFL